MTQSNILLLLANVNHHNDTHATSKSQEELYGNKDTNETSLTSQYITILYIGALFGAIISFPFVDNLGRKLTLIAALTFCMLMILWTLITISKHNLYYSRFFIGISLGFVMTISPMYIAEVATNTQRGQCISFLSMNNLLGSLYAITSFHLLSYFHIDWKYSFLFPILLICLQIYVIAFLPESPRWLLAKKTPSDCSVALQTIRRSHDIAREFNILYRALSSDARLGDSWLEIILSKTIRIRLFITILIQVIPQFLGIQFIHFFGYEIMKEMDIQSIFISIVLIFFSGFIGTIFLFHYIENKGRHYLLSFGNNCISILWIVLSGIVFFKIYYLDAYFDDLNDTPPSEFPTLSPTPSPSSNEFSYFFPNITTLLGASSPPPPLNKTGPVVDLSNSMYYYEFLTCFFKFLYITCLCLFYCNYFLSWGSISWIYTAEIFPYRARAKAVSITTSIHYFSALVASQLLQFVLQLDNDDNAEIPTITTTTDDYSITPTIPTATSLLSSSFSMYGASNVNGGSNNNPHFSVFYTYLDLHNIAECFFVLGITCFLMNIVIYFMIPETSGLMLEEMEELFKIENLNFCCGCIPTYRRVFSYHHPAPLSSLLPSTTGMSLTNGLGIGTGGNYGTMMNGNDDSYAIFDDPSKNHSMKRVGPGGPGGNNVIVDEEIVMYEPKSLHKYSRDMRESKFSYYHDPVAPASTTSGSTTTTQPSVPPSSGKKSSQSIQDTPTKNNSGSNNNNNNNNTTSRRSSLDRFEFHHDEPTATHRHHHHNNDHRNSSDHHHYQSHQQHLQHQQDSLVTATYTDLTMHSDEDSTSDNDEEDHYHRKKSFSSVTSTSSLLPYTKRQLLADPFSSITKPRRSSSISGAPSNPFSTSSANSSKILNSASSVQTNTGGLSSIGMTLYESLFNSNQKPRAASFQNYPTNNGHHHHQSHRGVGGVFGGNGTDTKRYPRNGGGRHGRENSDDEGFSHGDDEEHYEPLIESLAVKLAFEK